MEFTLPGADRIRPRPSPPRRSPSAGPQLRRGPDGTRPPPQGGPRAEFPYGAWIMRPQESESAEPAPRAMMAESPDYRPPPDSPDYRPPPESPDYRPPPWSPGTPPPPEPHRPHGLPGASSGGPQDLPGIA